MLFLWIASFAFLSSIFAADRCTQPKRNLDSLSSMQLLPAYNTPSRIEVRGAWDVYAMGSFTYWQPIQENMELGAVENSLHSTDVQDQVINSNFSYAPGFQFGLGLDLDRDHWDTCVEYTWFRGSQNNATHLNSATTTTQIQPAWIYPEHGAFTAFEASQSWKLHMDILDWELARSYLVGTKLSFRPFFAARSAWIRQNHSANYSNVLTHLAALERSLSHSWGIGPRTGLNAEWLLGEGIRVFGNVAGDLLFTQYTHLNASFQELLLGNIVEQHSFHQNDLNTLRTHLELALGFGWGSYFDNNNWHIDLSAGYGFQVFFNQNMFRKFLDSSSPFVSISPNGDLFMHGLTVTGRFDF